jgi:hypothetical protein
MVPRASFAGVSPRLTSAILLSTTMRAISGARYVKGMADARTFLGERASDGFAPPELAVPRRRGLADQFLQPLRHERRVLVPDLCAQQIRNIPWRDERGRAP